MELKAEDVKNIRSLAVCKELLRQAIEQIDQLTEKLKKEREFGLNRARDADHTIGQLCHDLCTQSAELRRQKYKRCLIIIANIKAAMDSAFFVSGEYLDWLSKWHERWLKLAEIFKETK